MADTKEKFKRATQAIHNVVETAASTPEGQNQLKRNQLRELAALNGTPPDDENQACQKCGEIAAATTIMLEDLEVLHHGSKLQRRLRLEVWLCFLQQKGSPPGHSSLGDNNCLLDLGGIDTFHSILEHGGKYI